MYRGWDKRYTELLEFKRVHGHCRVPRFHRKPAGLGMWVSAQRAQASAGTLAPERRARLERLGFTWNTSDASWEGYIKQLRAFAVVHGHANVPHHSPRADPRLRHWLAAQRQRYANGRLTEQRVADLVKVGVTLPTRRDAKLRDDDWAERFQVLRAFAKTYGHPNVPFTYADRSLARFVALIRARHRKGTLEPKHKREVDLLGLDLQFGRHHSVVPRDEYRLRELEAFHRAHRHARPSLSRGASERSLALWLGTQRKLRRRGKLKPERLSLLDSLGVLWDPDQQLWEEGFERLEAFKRRHHHARGPFQREPKLAYWVANQRRAHSAGKLSPDRTERLEKLGLPWDGNATRAAETVDHHMKLLEQFLAQHGHLSIPSRPPHTALFAWVAKQRELKRKHHLDKGLARHLSDIGLPFDKASIKWEQAFAAAVEFCRRSQRLALDDSSPVGLWLAAQRSLAEAGKLEATRADRLDELAAIDIVRRGIHWTTRETAGNGELGRQRGLPGS